MIHCVGACGDQCAGGESRILSVQVQGNRADPAGRRRLEQHPDQAPHNRDVEADLNQLMDEYAMRYTRAAGPPEGQPPQSLDHPSLNSTHHNRQSTKPGKSREIGPSHDQEPSTRGDQDTP